MDCSAKVAIENIPDQRHSSETQTDAASTSSVEQLEGSYPCPACSLVLTSSRDLTNHLRGHNSPRSTDYSGEEDYSCGVCHKVLSSASSLDRHVLVHSGERPFKCKYCDMAFTTNGNMNRHLRTAHREVSPHSYTDSEGSSDSERPATRRHVDEYNNNEIAKRSSPDLVDPVSPAARSKRKRPEFSDDSDIQRKHKILLNNSRIDGKNILQSYMCPVCPSLDFPTGALLEAHLEKNHPDYTAECDTCNRSFKNHRVLNLHRFMVHFTETSPPPRNLRNSVIGFNDLTFVDFSADKFPAIARAVCEQSLHRPASGESATFQCSKCLRAFPCKSALEAHEMDCGTLHYQTSHVEDDHSKRNNFFAGLDLQNKAAMTEAKEGKDLADIQSIISVTSGPIFPRSDASTPDQHIKMNPNVNSSGSSGTASSENNEEEAQDAFSAELRKMKLKGEFPCRLCSAIFPNLRALKGHHKEHMGVGPGMPYPCNVCPFTSTDKAALSRHLKSHNGVRPYQCSLCKYAFTTKANCERHVKNGHKIMTREEIKSVLIYHASEDAANEGLDRTSPRAIRDDARKSLVYPERDELQSQPHYPLNSRHSDLIAEEVRLRQLASMQATPVSHYEKSDVFSRPPPMHLLELSHRMSEDSENPQDFTRSNYSRMQEEDSRSSDESASLANDVNSDAHQRAQASPIDLKSTSTGASSDAPLDLSMDALDLSKKAKGNGIDLSTTDEFDKSQKDMYESATNQLLLTQALLKAGQSGNSPSSLEALYANAHLLYRNFGGFPGTGVGGGILPPYLFNPHIFGQDFAMRDRLQKELVRGLQLTSGGTLVEPPLNNASFPPGYPHGRDLASRSHEEQNDYSKIMASKIVNKVASPREKMDTTPTSNSVKMVIKNGVLMPKQKQRRYRTEKPFSCEHCSARFTLRSNMERHIKQQHPQHWSQRPRGGHSTRGRPPTNPPSLLHGMNHSNQPLQPTYPNILPKIGQSSEYGKHAISDQVKYAILAQQLKGNKHEENDTDEELIIDEGVDKESDNHEEERPISLLRGKLEESVRDSNRENNEPLSSSDTGMDQDPIAINIKPEPEEINESKPKPSDDEEMPEKTSVKGEDGNADLASVSELLDNASQQYQQFQPQYMSDEEGLVASTSDCNNSGSDEKSDSVNSANSGNSSSSKLKKLKKKKKKKKKKSAYSMAPNRVICPYCERPFPWTSSLRRHILTHTGQKPYQCVHCSLLFTTKSNCDRHLLRKHKANPNKMRRVRTSSSPEAQEVSTNNNGSFSMRNVPERPYKCNQCPSSTFSTLGNLKKHRSTKHSNEEKSRPESPMSEAHSERQNSPVPTSKQNDQSGYESQSSSVSENLEQSAAPIEVSKSTLNTSSSANETPRSRRPSPRASPGPTDAPFKCHLCDSGFAERQDCLEHIKENHKRSYEMLLAKGALDMETENLEEQQPPPSQSHHSDGEEKRGKFPDYSNRKVVCAFCMRRFWSAEDLRRHMRTHTGERPFSCDICSRRFTLKHSMLRHRKKHESVDSTMYVGTSGDEESAPTQPPTITPRTQQQTPLISVTTGESRMRERISLPTVATIATGDAAPSSLMRFNPYEKLTTLTGKLANAQNFSSEQTPDNENDLISNLLGIRDKSIIDKVLQASADDAAKLLGVNRSHE